MKVAVFPGSFDPFTIGHEDILRKALPLFDQIVVAIGVNSTKNALFSLQQRKTWIEQIFQSDPKVLVTEFEGLTIDLCQKHGAQFIVRGLRNANDFHYESNIAHMNASMSPDIQTVFLVCDPALSAINSTIVREIYRNGGDVSKFLPKGFQLHD
jgi:pantetheine-phosphate adenylyltransferase